MFGLRKKEREKNLRDKKATIDLYNKVKDFANVKLVEYTDGAEICIAVDCIFCGEVLSYYTDYSNYMLNKMIPGETLKWTCDHCREEIKKQNREQKIAEYLKRQEKLNETIK
jgi:hypothetical protein